MNKVRRGARDAAAVDEFVERFAAAMVDAGMPRMPALVFASLLATDDARLTADDLVARLQVSRAAVSGAVRYLADLGIVRRERQPGSRREYYVFEHASWYEMVARREQILARWVSVARDGVSAVGPRTPAGQRLAESVAFFEFLQAEMPAMLARWRRRRPQP